MSGALSLPATARVRGGVGSIRYEAKGACFLEFGGGRVAAVDANFLGGPEPRVVLRGASDTYRPDKEAFIADRLARWFGATS